jgi:GNAT superfamily N-acetyltransferase
VMFVRLGLESDEDAFVALAAAAVAESVPYVPFSAVATVATYRRYLETANPTFFVCEDNHELIGFLQAGMAAYDFADPAFFYTSQQVVFVHPAKRGTRAAALLMRAFIAWSDRLGAVENTGGNDNDLKSERTSRFLEAFGFRRVGYFVRRMRGARNGKKR